MTTHSAHSLFQLNIKSAKDCLSLYNAISQLKVRAVDIDWILRAAVVFAISSIDSYFHDKIKYRLARYNWKTLPPALGNFEIPIVELVNWEKAERKGNVLRNWVVKDLSVKPLQSKKAITDALKLCGIDSLWDTIEPDRQLQAILLKEFGLLVQRRNQISHEGDRKKSRGSGKTLRKINVTQVQGSISFVEDIVARIESAFPG
jgi:hypothetical protein